MVTILILRKSVAISYGKVTQNNNILFSNEGRLSGIATGKRKGNF